jgi:hypothetical protein
VVISQKVRGKIMMNKKVTIVIAVLILGALAAVAVYGFAQSGIQNITQEQNIKQPVMETAQVSQAPVTQTPVITGPVYVLCSDYHKITDRYKTPAGYYLKIYGVNEALSLTQDQYNNTKIGEYVKYLPSGIRSYPIGENFGYWYDSETLMEGNTSLVLIPVTEKESGYREACKVI